MLERIVGLDLGAETVKVAELVRDRDVLRPGRTWVREHGKDPAGTLASMLDEIEWTGVRAAAVTGRMANTVRLEVIPFKVSVAEGLRLLRPEIGAATVVSIGAHGFSVTDVRGDGSTRVRESSRCSQGTGNFLRQLVERLDLDLEAADALCEDAEAAPLSGRCPVILKTDLTHLANKGVPRGQILAGLYDAVCENVQGLIRQKDVPPHLLLIGGVARSGRIRRNFARVADRLSTTFVEWDTEFGGFLEAFGAASLAARRNEHPPSRGDLFARTESKDFTRLAAFRSALSRVHRMPAYHLALDEREHDVILGLDIGSTGSKGLAIDRETREPLWEHYTSTLGDPVGAAQRIVTAFLAASEGRLNVRAVGATGSGREIVGSLLASCFGVEVVFVLNEIAAHAEGALFFDRDVDTIFEIGGQDAKYIRLDAGRICDAAMNEACSAGTGSFIEEQGRKFEGVDDVVQMAEYAIESDCAVSLGQHCSVFMAEVIDQAVAAGRPNREIIAGIYDSVVQNYLNRVKGSRSVGTRIFCQGMPFMSDALAAAVAQRTGGEVIVPPNPGTIGALGIALLTGRELADQLGEDLDLNRFLAARVDEKDQFVCGSTKGCGGSGNLCRIDRIRVTVEGQQKKFVWGGSCSLYDRGAKKRKLPDLTPNPFSEREALIDGIVAQLGPREGRPRIAITDEFSMKGLFPFFATFLDELGFALEVSRGGTQKQLKAGIQLANVPFCAPMQLFHGIAENMLAAEPDYLFAPMVVDLPHSGDEKNSVACPIVQASPGVVEHALLRDHEKTRLLDPKIEMGTQSLDSPEFERSCRSLARHLGASRRFRRAMRAALVRQREFIGECRRIGARSVDFAAAHDVPAVVVLGRSYTIYNDVLNSNVPNLLRDLGALAIPVDCYPIADDVPAFQSMYWHYGQLNLRAAHQIRRADGVYSIYCSNYACGPDSFNLHFFAYAMENKPFALIETDGHSGDAGTRTRIEAFLYCVENDRRTSAAARRALPRQEFQRLEQDPQDLIAVRDRGDLLLIPPMGVGADVIASAFRSEGFRTEVLAKSTEESLGRGRRETSGKECLPMILTAGALLRRVESEPDLSERFAFLMPTTCGPCRFGAYNVLHKIILERTGLADRVRVVAPSDSNYFAGLSPDLTVRVWTGIVAVDLLHAGLLEVRPVERDRGAAQAIYDRYFDSLRGLLERPSTGSVKTSLAEVERGMFGIRALVRDAAREFAAAKDRTRNVPTVSVVGEIYVRTDPFANSFVIDRLESAGLRARLAPVTEWIEFTTFWREKRIFEGRARATEGVLDAWFSGAVERRVADRLYHEMAQPLGWGHRLTVGASVAEGERYARHSLETETVLTVGGGLREYLEGQVDGIISVGPLECMPNRVAESHFDRMTADFGVPTMTLSLNGDPLDERALEDFVYEVKEGCESSRNGRSRGEPHRVRRPMRNALWESSGRAAVRAIGAVLPGRDRA